MQMQSAMLYKQMQKADAHLPTGISDKSVFPLMLHFTASLYSFTALNITYYSMKYQNT